MLILFSSPRFLKMLLVLVLSNTLWFLLVEIIKFKINKHLKYV